MKLEPPTADSFSFASSLFFIFIMNNFSSSFSFASYSIRLRIFQGCSGSGVFLFSSITEEIIVMEEVTISLLTLSFIFSDENRTERVGEIDDLPPIYSTGDG